MFSTIVCILIGIVLLTFLLWGAVCALVLRLAHKLKDMSRQEWVQALRTYMEQRSRRKLFVEFLAAEVAIAGGVIPFAVKVWFANSQFSFFVELSNQSDWLSLSVAIIIAIVFFVIIYRSDSKHSEEWNEVFDAARFVNDELKFAPSKQWFENQNEIAIKALDKRYSPDVNFPFEDMDWLLASLNVGDGFKDLMWNELDEETKSIKSYLRHNKDKVADDVKKVCLDVVNGIYKLDSDPSTYKELRGKVQSLVENLHDFNVHKEELQDYNYRDLNDKTYQLQNTLEKIWFDVKESKCWIITGEAGMGKSHLIGDVVTQRKNKGEPSVLLLGQHFTMSTDPISQMKQRLDILCKSESMLQQLNLYGQRIGKTVVIFIDALNEGAGDELWKNYWQEVTAKFEGFEYLRLVVSFRISGIRNWFYDLAYNQDKVPVYFHQGFKGNEQRACEFMFRSYGLDQPLWPVYGTEFANPLFLKSYCRLHEKTGKPLQPDNFWETINDYCDWLNHELSLSKHYPDNLKLVTDAMRCIASLMVDAGSRWHLEFKKINAALVEVAEFFSDSKDFMRIMIDEGLLRLDSYGGVTYVNYAYELIGDFFLADCLLEQGNIDSAKMWSLGEGIPEAMAVIAPYKNNVEAFEIVANDAKDDALQAMFESSGWRDTFSEKGKEELNKLKVSKDYGLLFSVILNRPFRNDDAANSTMLYDLLWPMSMVERDSVWTVAISDSWHIGRNALELAEWGMNVSAQALSQVEKTTLRRCAETLVWICASTDRKLRDTSTHALVNILAECKDLMLPLLEKFYKVNDPYIEERLWASVMGALTCCQDKLVAKTVALWVYANVFLVRCVPENILVRDYAKGIIKYAQSLDDTIQVDESLLLLPFSNAAIPNPPTCDEVKAKYENDDWQHLQGKALDVWRSKQRILSSMATEYSPRTNCNYGDFGRYVFQANLSYFPVNPELMANWAIQMIFEEFGYDPMVFANFDINVHYTGRSRNDVERIGKKYQWIALYKILARLSDVYPDLNFEDEFYTPTQSARNIDPTYRIDTSLSDNRRSKYTVPQYDLTKPKDNLKWLRGWRRMPLIEKYIFTIDKDGIEWVNLYSHNNIKCPKRLTEQELMIRELWTFIQAFAVKKEHIKTVCKQIRRIGLEGRDFRENREIDGIYSREFFWSDVYHERVKAEHYGFAPFSLGRKGFPEIDIAPAYLIYNHSSSEDASQPNGVEILYPNEWLYKGMGLEYGKLNGEWVDAQSKTVVIDNAEYGKGHSALLIRKDVLLDYLNKEGLVMFWPVLSERETRFDNGTPALGYEQNGGWVYMDSKGKLHYKFRTYVPSALQKKVTGFNRNLKQRLIRRKFKMDLYLSKHGLKKMSVEEKLRMIYEDEILD